MEFYKLTPQQKIILELISLSPLAKTFYFTGGTALSSVYLQHRYSEDLDFFSEEEVDISQLTSYFKKWKKQIGYDSIDIQTSMNRNLVFFHFPNNEVLKTEFTYYPFPVIEKKLKFNKLQIDSLKDIATNKLFAISQKNRSRDFIDLYFIFEKEQIKLKDLYFTAKQKFDWHIDHLHLASQLLSFDPSDMTMLYHPVSEEKIRHFFEEQAKLLAKEILSP
jgi:predicted nucleotidyltransferase component of viral defense system